MLVVWYIEALDLISQEWEYQAHMHFLQEGRTPKHREAQEHNLILGYCCYLPTRLCATARKGVSPHFNQNQSYVQRQIL